MSDLSTLLADVIPIAVGAAVSPTVLIGIILVLSISNRPKLNGIAFYIGAIILLLIVCAAGIVASEGAVLASNGQPSMTSAYFDIILGILLILLGIRRIRKEDKGPDKNRFAGESKSTGAQFIKYMILGFAMFVINFTTTVLVFAAGKDIGLSSASIFDKFIVIVVLSIITLLVVEIPLLIYFTMPKRSEKILGHLNIWMQKNSRYLMAGVMFLFGIYLMVKGIRVLF